MKIILRHIEVYKPAIREDKLLTFKKYFPKAEFMTIDDFIPKSYEDNYSEDNEKNKEYGLKLFKEYNKLEYKTIKGYNHETICDINIFLHDFPNLQIKILGDREVFTEETNTDSLIQKETYIENLIRGQEERLNNMMNTFVKMSEKLAENLKIDTLNQKCDVHVGGGMLMTVNEILLLEDSCSDALQDSLNSGWRILAINVQNDCRRPDYILGRFNPNYESVNSAKRS